jgi:Ca2+-binding EF-hand superfamily protein
MKTSSLFLISLSVICAPTACASPPQTSGSALIAADANGDGQLTRDEFLAERSARFPGLDKDASGGLGLDEFSQALTGKLRSFAGRAFSKVDSNGDGTISRAEWDANPPRAFDKADGNHDGVLSQEEISRLNR